MKISFTILFALLFAGSAYSQKDSIKSAYKHLPLKRFYTVGIQKDSVKGKVTYKVNNKEVDKKTYSMYEVAQNNMKTCKPCLLETYNVEGVLLFKAVQYIDCMVGEWFEYYPSGKIKVVGHYRENETGTWDQLWDGGYCIKHGTWTYYDEKGKVTNVEKYSFGNIDTHEH